LSRTDLENQVLAVEGSEVDWHRKLGHLGLQNMKKLIPISQGMVFNTKKTKLGCEVCTFAKQARKPFQGHLPKATRPCEIINTDLCGPVSPVTHDGYKYFITFIDSYTRYLEERLLRSKDEAANATKQFINKIEKQTGFYVSKLKSEYLPLRDWCKNRGIITDFSFSASYSQQQNGISERKNRTLIEKVRALLFDSIIDKRLWGEALI